MRRVVGALLRRMREARGNDSRLCLLSQSVLGLQQQMRECAACNDAGTCADDIRAGIVGKTWMCCPNHGTVGDKGGAQDQNGVGSLPCASSATV